MKKFPFIPASGWKRQQQYIFLSESLGQRRLKIDAYLHGCESPAGDWAGQQSSWLMYGCGVAFTCQASQSPRVYFSSRPTFGLVEEKTRRLCLCRVRTHHMSWHALVMKRCASGLSACFCRRRPCWFVHVSKISMRFDSFVFQTQI